ncbi:MAG TPA: multidrug efflux SMR transporter [Mariprofundaceae bacterium]|nr:multidrug efflux SMR transporter [Mariprofundaceae bacterium]
MNVNSHEGDLFEDGCSVSMLAAWSWLALAIALEVSGTVCLKLSEGFSRPVPTILIVVFYMASFSAMVMSLKRIELGVAYAVWAGIGTALIAVLGIVLFKESTTALKLAALVLIISGVVMLHLSNQGA